MELIIFLLIMFFACFFQGITGFGFALIAAPLALIFLDKITVVSSLMIVGIFLNAFLFIKIRHHINMKLFLPLLIAGLVGMPIGIWILKSTPVNYLKIFAGSLSVIFTLIIYLYKIKLAQTEFLKVLVGLLSGILQTGISMGGPPVVLLLTGSGQVKNMIRKTLVTFFLCLNIVSLPMFFYAGTLTWERISYGFYALPFVFIGAYLGDRVVEKIPQKTFRLLALVTICATGIFTVYSGLYTK